MNLSLLKLSLFQYFLCSHSQKLSDRLSRLKPVQFLAPHRFHLATVVSNVLQEEDYESRSSTSILEDLFCSFCTSFGFRSSKSYRKLRRTAKNRHKIILNAFSVHVMWDEPPATTLQNSSTSASFSNEAYIQTGPVLSIKS